MGPDARRPAAEQLLQRGDLRAGQVPHLGIARLEREAGKAGRPIIRRIVQRRGRLTTADGSGQGAESGLGLGAPAAWRLARRRLR
jgi:hypothetical protein